MADSIITPFNPSPSANFQFQANLDGSTYNIVCTWNPYALRYYVNFYDLTGTEVLSRPLIGSPDTSNISLTAGYFDTTVIYRDSRAVFEVPGLDVTPAVIKPPAPPPAPPPPPIPYRYFRLTVTRWAHDGSVGVSGDFSLTEWDIHNQNGDGIWFAMTSNTTSSPPSNQIVTASSELDFSHEAWKAINHDLTDASSWTTAFNPGGPQYIQMDLGPGIAWIGASTSIALDSSAATIYPVDFKIEASNTGDFTGEQAFLFGISNVSGWLPNTERHFVF